MQSFKHFSVSLSAMALSACAALQRTAGAASFSASVRAATAALSAAPTPRRAQAA